MSEPITTIDTRFSDPNATATPWEESRRELETAELFWLITVRVDSHPHLTPLVAVWLDGSLYFCTGDTEQKARNLRRNPHVILAAGSLRWNAGIDIVVEGDAVQITDENLLKRLVTVWAAKWDGRWQYKVREGVFYGEDGKPILVFSVMPTKGFAFAKAPRFGQTRYQF